MERISVFKIKKGLVKFFIISGIVFFLFGMIFLIISFSKGFNTVFIGGDWNYVFYSAQGILFFFFGYSLLKSEKYFIEWDNSEIRYFLPKNKLIETIRLSDIKSIEIKLHEIKIQLPESAKIINLKNFHFNELKLLKEKFYELKGNADKVQAH